MKMTYPIQLGICSCCHEKETVTSPECIALIPYIFYLQVVPHTLFVCHFQHEDKKIKNNNLFNFRKYGLASRMLAC